MSTGIVHANATRKNLWGISGLAFLGGLTVHPAFLAMIVGGILGHWITPDYDINHPVYTQRKLINKFWVFGWLWIAYWYPYRQLNFHRGSSHSWPLGTLIRFVYLLWLPIFLSGTYLPFWLYGPAWSAVFLGWSVQDLCHLWMDGIRPFSKTRKIKPNGPHFIAAKQHYRN